MAVRSPNVKYELSRGYVKVIWSGLLTTDSGEHFDAAGYQVESVQVIGTFGAAGTITMQWTNEDVPTNNVAATPFGTAGVISAAGLFLPVLTSLASKPMAAWLRPLVGAGDGTTNLSVTAILSKAHR